MILKICEIALFTRATPGSSLVCPIFHCFPPPCLNCSNSYWLRAATFSKAKVVHFQNITNQCFCYKYFVAHKNLADVPKPQTTVLSFRQFSILGHLPKNHNSFLSYKTFQFTMMIAVSCFSKLSEGLCCQFFS